MCHSVANAHKDTVFSRIEARGRQGHSDQKIVCSTPGPQGVSNIEDMLRT